MKITPLENWIASQIGGQPEPAYLQAYQLRKLRETIEYARARSRFYKEHLPRPVRIGSLVDFTRLPFTSPADIAHAPNDFLCVSPREVDRIVTLSTSGTTGNPKRVFFSEEDQELTIDFFNHGMTTLTDSTDRVMIFMPGTTPGSVGDLLVKGLTRFGCTGIVYGPIKDYGHAALALHDENITAVVGIPSQILTLARTTTAGAIPRVKNILLSADYVPTAAVAAIQKAWDAVVYGHYGMTETGLGGGVECEARCGYHLREADLYYEVIDPTTGLPVPDGDYGEVVFTTLTRRGMPLIRYRTGDWARFLLEPCPCGSVLRRLGKVAGRIAEPVRLNANQTLSVTQLDEIVLADDDVLSYEAALETRDGQDCLCLTVRSDGRADLRRISHSLQKALPQLFASGGLLLDIREGDPYFFTTGTLKRRIEDHRKTENRHI
jgi:phenylacetate-coenzyme A ligase PaaK-like adenylate-forming protein